MTHRWHDTYHHISTPAHHLDPRSKLFVGLFFILIVLLTPHLSWVQALGYPLLIVLAATLSGVPLKRLGMRFLTILPFALLMGISAVFSHLSQPQLLDILLKAICSIAATALLTMTTPFPDLLRALEQMYLPRLLVMFLAFLYRYGGVLYEEALQLERAWSARYFGRYWIKQWMHLGHILAALFIRSYERAERIFSAMQARGFSSGAAGVQLLHFEWGDLIFVSGSVVLLMAVRWISL